MPVKTSKAFSCFLTLNSSSIGIPLKVREKENISNSSSSALSKWS